MNGRRKLAIQLLILAAGLWLVSYFHGDRGPEWHRVAGWFAGLVAFLYAEFLLLTMRRGRR
jgi:hypothetical protein